MFQFCYTLSEDGYFEFNRYHAFHSPANKKNMLIYRFVVPIIFAVCGLIAGIIAYRFPLLHFLMNKNAMIL